MFACHLLEKCLRMIAFWYPVINTIWMIHITWYADSFEDCCTPFVGFGLAQEYVGGVPVGAQYYMDAGEVITKCCVSH